MDFYDVINKRRTVREFENDDIPMETIERIVDAAMKAPSNDHLRDWEYIVIKDKNIMAKVLDVDVEKERSSLGIKQLQKDSAADALANIQKGNIVTCTVIAVQPNGIEVKVSDVLTGFIRRTELARDKAEQRSDRFSVGEMVDAKVVSVDRVNRKVTLTIKGREIEEDKQVISDYGSTDSGASLGDILGAAIRRRNDGNGDE